MDGPTSRFTEKAQSFTAEDYKNLTNRLRWLAKKRWRWLRPEEIDDMIGRAVFDAYAGRRRWPADIEIDVVWFLWMIVRSNYSHLAPEPKPKGPEPGRAETVEDELERDGRRRPQVQSLNDITEGLIAHGRLLSPQPEGPDRQIEYREFCRDLLELVAGDKELSAMIRALIEHPESNLKEVAEMLGLTPMKRRNAERRLKRRFEKPRKGEATCQRRRRKH